VPALPRFAPHDVLKSTWGYESYRPLQGEIVDAILSGRDVIALLPTGGGKSLCYQLPAILLPGTTVVVSPLIALMKDQVDALQTAGVAATFINSTLTPSEIGQRQASVARGDMKLVYVAPERLASASFMQLLAGCELSLLAIDEAHCISEWGHDFRPEYRQLSKLRAQFPHAPLAAFTATATKRVQSDIIEQLQLRDPARFTGSFNRPNLYYEVRPKKDTYAQILSYLRSRPSDSGIIYRQSRTGTEDLAGRLIGDGIEAFAYHAGLDAETRRARQDVFRHGRARVIVATIAFGLGIDKPDVRFVIHHDLPKTLESYYQESGRAGRDGESSDCILFYSYSDVQFVKRMMGSKPPAERRVAEAALRTLIDWAEAGTCRRAKLLAHFDEHGLSPQERCCDNCDRGVVTSISHNTATVDVTTEAQMFLSCVKRTGELFGQTHITAVLRGSKSKRVLQWGHETLSTYGIGRHRDEAFWAALADRLDRDRLIASDERRSISVTAQGWEVLRGEREVSMGFPLNSPPTGRTTDARKVGPSPSQIELFDRLRAVRTRIADDRGVPPYVILWDRSLVDMCERVPTTLAELRQVYGFGEVKIEQFGEDFLRELARQDQ
jgi:ATP-dependent DNA helicase RecQ